MENSPVIGGKYGEGYGRTEGQMGIAVGDTFWAAARDVLLACHRRLKPGATTAWVVKAFVRDGAIVDFPADWRRLLEATGYVPFLEVRASLVSTTAEASLFGGEEVRRRERKSFFRRLAEKKGSPRIDHETVWFARRGDTP